MSRALTGVAPALLPVWGEQCCFLRELGGPTGTWGWWDLLTVPRLPAHPACIWMFLNSWYQEFSTSTGKGWSVQCLCSHTGEPPPWLRANIRPVCYPNNEKTFLISTLSYQISQLHLPPWLCCVTGHQQLSQSGLSTAEPEWFFPKAAWQRRS